MLEASEVRAARIRGGAAAAPRLYEELASRGTPSSVGAPQGPFPLEGIAIFRSPSAFYVTPQGEKTRYPLDLASEMTGDAAFYRDLAYVFGAAVVGGAVARRLRQPLILGYVLGGVLVGPFTPGPTVSDVHQFEILAEVGVILLMYSIGLEISFRDLLRVKWVAILGGPLGISLSAA